MPIESDNATRIVDAALALAAEKSWHQVSLADIAARAELPIIEVYTAFHGKAAILEAFHKRRVYGATDNILADVRCGTHFMGEEFSTSEPPAISVKLWGAANFAKVHIIRDGEYVYSIEPNKKTVDFVWKDAAPRKGQTAFYYVRGEQSDGELVWVSPMWITCK